MEKLKQFNEDKLEFLHKLKEEFVNRQRPQYPEKCMDDNFKDFWDYLLSKFLTVVGDEIQYQELQKETYVYQEQYKKYQHLKQSYETTMERLGIETWDCPKCETASPLSLVCSSCQYDPTAKKVTNG